MLVETPVFRHHQRVAESRRGVRQTHPVQPPALFVHSQPLQWLAFAVQYHNVRRTPLRFNLLKNWAEPAQARRRR
ncbi:hypothetical protein JOS77_26550 [Chromobacterium haemolyticum]|nr:hypothetical protein JOS77_26550 [Chromobacterium haemolyticum]